MTLLNAHSTVLIMVWTLPDLRIPQNFTLKLSCIHLAIESGLSGASIWPAYEAFCSSIHADERVVAPEQWAAFH